MTLLPRSLFGRLTLLLGIVNDTRLTLDANTGTFTASTKRW